MMASILCHTHTDRKGVKLEVFYHPRPREFEVVLTYVGPTQDYVRRERFAANYEPRFGMDCLDMDDALELANKLAKELDKEAGL